MKRLIIFLIRKRLGLRKYETFQFTNQKSSSSYYYFGRNMLIKDDERDGIREAHVSLNWLLNDYCMVTHYDPFHKLDYKKVGDPT